MVDFAYLPHAMVIFTSVALGGAFWSFLQNSSEWNVVGAVIAFSILSIFWMLSIIATIWVEIEMKRERRQSSGQ